MNCILIWDPHLTYMKQIAKQSQLSDAAFFIKCVTVLQQTMHCIT